MNKADKALELIQNIDFSLLKKQKQALLNSNLSAESLEGVLSLIDSFQDFAVDVMGKDEDEVFQFEEDASSPQEEVVYDEPQEWNVPISRVGYANMLIAVTARSESEAIAEAIELAGSESFSDHNADYTAPDGAHRISDDNQ